MVNLKEIKWDVIKNSDKVAGIDPSQGTWFELHLHL